MRQIASFAALCAAVVAASATIPAFADGEQGTATLEDDILTLSGLVTNITAEADLGASVTQVVMTAEGGVAFGASVGLSQKYYAFDGTGIVRVAEGKRVSTAAGRLKTLGHTLVKDGPGTLYFTTGTSVVNEPTRWIVKEGELRFYPNSNFFGGHGATTTNLVMDLREGTTFYQEQVLDGNCHLPMGPLEMTGARFVYGPSTFPFFNPNNRDGNAAFKGGVLVHASATPSYMYWPRASHLGHVDPNCVFNVEEGGKLIVHGVLTNGVNSAYNADLQSVLVKRGGGELVLLRPCGWTGGTVLEDGTITVADADALGASTLTIAGDVTINIPAGVTFICPPLAVDGTHTLTVTGGGVFTPPATIPDNLTLANNAAGTASTLVGSTLYLMGGTITLSVASDMIITSMVDEGSGLGKYTDIVKTGAGTLTLPTGMSEAYHDLIVKEGLVSVSAESCFGWGETTVNGGGIRYTANVSQTAASRPIRYVGSGTIDIPEGVSWSMRSNIFTCANAVVTKTGAGRWVAGSPFMPAYSAVGGARWIVHEGTLRSFNGDMFAGYNTAYNLPVEVHDGAVFEIYSGGIHLPVRDITLRGGTLFALRGQFNSSNYGVEGGYRWKGWGLNGPITVLPSLNGQPSRIIARACHLGHGTNGSTTFDVRAGATLEVDAMLEPGRANSSSSPNDGSFVKIGGGTLKILKGCAAKGLVDIREGTVELAAGVHFNPAATVNVSPNAKLVLGDKVQVANAMDLASALCASADVWLDASRLTLADGAAATSVPNLGTAGGNFAKFTWSTPVSNPYKENSSATRVGQKPAVPTFTANGINGEGVLNFNGVQALCLPTYTNKTQHLKVFYVAEWTYWSQGTGSQGGKGKWGGPMSFGNRSMTNEDNNMPGVLSFIHGGTSVKTMSTTPYTGASITLEGLDVGTPYLVSSYLTHTNKCSTVYLNDSTPPQSASAANSADNKVNVNAEFVCLGGRTTKGGGPEVWSDTPWVGSRDRMFVGYIGEMLAFTRTLTADEEAQILAYLKRKWFNSSVTVSEETEKALANTVRIEVPEGAEASYVANVAGKTDGTTMFDLTKTGAGTLRYGGAVTGGAVIDVEAGDLKLKDARLPSQVDVWVDAADLTTMTFDDDSRVTNLVNKGSAGGTFTRNRRASAVPYGPTVKEGAAGMNGNPVLAFDGNEALILNAYTNFTAPREMYVYFAARRMKYVDEGGQGKWGGLFAFGSTAQNGEDQTHYGVCYLSQSTLTGCAIDYGANSTTALTPPEIGEPMLLYFFNSTNGYYFAIETNATPVTKVPSVGSFAQANEPFQIDVLQLGGRLMNYGKPQWYNEGNTRNRFGYFDMGELIATTRPLGEHQEAELLDYLRKKWLNKGSGSATPPTWLTGIPATATTDADTALVMADGTSLQHEAATKALGALVTEGTVDWTRVWDGVTASSFPLFAVGGDVSLGAVNLTPDPKPTEAQVLGWTGTLVNPATWRLLGADASSSGITLRAAEKAYWINPVGTLIMFR